jgi:hypothetical protein
LQHKLNRGYRLPATSDQLPTGVRVAPTVGVKRSRVLPAVTVLLMIAGISTWLLTAEARGSLPLGSFDASPHIDWPVTPAHAAAIRQDAFRRAAVRVPGPVRPSTRSGRPEPVEGRGSGGPSNDDSLTCRYLADEPSGTSPKFNCVLDGGEIVKVKYGRNSEIHAEAAATTLLSLLGYPADDVRVVRRVRCYGCPRFPFLATQLLSIAHVPALLGPHGYDDGYTDFEWVAVERRFDAPAIETIETKGWAWYELQSSQAPRTELDALRLLAVFLAHWDNKSENQRLVCLDTPPAQPDQPCARPLLMIQDLGATFGPTKVNIAAWRDMPVWADRATCAVSMKPLPYQGATFPDARISEAGRAQLAQALSALSTDQIKGLFADARFPEYQSATDDDRDLEAWTSAFKYRLNQIASASC